MCIKKYQLSGSVSSWCARPVSTPADGSRCFSKAGRVLNEAPTYGEPPKKTYLNILVDYSYKKL